MRMISLLVLSMLVATTSFASKTTNNEMRWVQIQAKDKHERTQIANLGVSIESTRSDSVWGFATREAIRDLKKHSIKVLGNYDFETARGGHEGGFANWDFPANDSNFHNYDELIAALKDLQTKNNDITTLESIGKTYEGRDMWAIHINTNPDALKSGQSNKPGMVYMGNHHAREHLSLEVPLMVAQHFLANRKDVQIANLLDNRDIWIIPSINPDGAEYDVKGGKYQMWRKNRRKNKDGTYGVDLNRNYGHGWGTGGSSTSTSSDVYMGTAPFSEPETQNVKAFVEAHSNFKILLTFHTYSELILYPWGGKNDPIADEKDHAVFKTMAETMAAWNHYTPEQASDLYIASGDTCDWAYGEHKIFAFTFELSPSQFGGGGFYPGEKIIDQVFNDNLKPVLYLLDAADNPYKVISQKSTTWLQNYAEPVFHQNWN